MGKSKAAKAQVPECRYGAACTRRDCIFRHPPKKERVAVPAQEKSDKVCFAYVAGRCAFGKFCHDRHPDEASCATIRDRYNKIDCQWGRGCRTEGCLYRHPSDEPVGPVMPREPAKPQPAVYAAGPTIVQNQAQVEAVRAKATAGRIEVLPIPKAISQAADLRDVSAFDINDPLDRFAAVNARNTGTQSAALLDLHLQSVQTVGPVLDDVLPERLKMFQQGGVWLVTGALSGASAAARPPPALPPGGGIFDAVREYLVRHRYEFAIGQDDAGTPSAFLVRSRKKRQDPLDGVRAIIMCGVPGSGKSMIAEALARKSGGRFLRVCQDDVRVAEDTFRRAVAEAVSAEVEARERAKSGCWWWDHAFSAEKYFLALCFRGAALTHLSDCFGYTPKPSESFHSVLAYQPTTLDLRRLLGRPHRVMFRAHLVLEATFAPHAGEPVEVVLCATQVLDGDAGVRATSSYIAHSAPQWAARHLQVLNAVPLEKRIMANSSLGSFKVRRVTDLSARSERLALCMLVHKAGEHRGIPAIASFDAACLMASGGSQGAAGSGASEWTELGDAALGSLSPLVVLEDTQGASAHDWASFVTARCSQLGFAAPEVKVSRPMGPAETKMEQWTRLRPSCLLHCAAEEANIAQILRGGAAALRRSGRAVLPLQAEAQALPPVVVLDRCNPSRAERAHWVTISGLQKSQVVALHLDVPEAECTTRVARRLGSSGHLPQHQAAAEAASLVRPQVERLEAPVEREGFRAIVRLKGAAAAAQELVRRWTEDGPAPAAESEETPSSASARGGGAMQAPEEEEEEEAPPPPLPQLSQWIEVEEQGGRRSVWGVPLGCPVDAPLEGLLGAASASDDRGGSPGSSPRGSRGNAGVFAPHSRLSHATAMHPSASSRPSSGPPAGCGGGPASAATAGWGGGLGDLQSRPPWTGPAEMGGGGLGWHPLEPEAPLCGPGSSAPAHHLPPAPSSQDEDAEECARQEQLAATLRCMGFDEEPSLSAAQRAGGNLNVAIESVLRSSGAVG